MQNIQYAIYAYNINTIYKSRLQSDYIICKSKIDKEQNRFVFVSGTGYVFAYRNLVMSSFIHSFITRILFVSLA